MYKRVILLVVFIWCLVVQGAVAASYDDDTTLHFYWTAATGNVHHYNVYLYIDGVLHPEVWTITTAPSAVNPYAVPIVAEVGQLYQLQVQAEDANGVTGPMSELSDLVVVDLTRPTTPIVTDNNDYTDDPTQLHASWTTSTDPESGIDHYQYSIGTTAGEADVKDWTSTGTETEVTVNGLSLILGKTYYFSVQAINGARTASDLGISDGIQVILPAPGIPIRPD